MNQSSPRRLAAILLLALAGFLTSGWALADPPSRVARLAYISGATSFSPGGEMDWVRASVNRPMITGDRLWVGEGARAELQLGSAAMRVGPSTSLTLLNLDDRTAQVQLTQGTLNIRVRRLDRGQVFEIDTPNLAYSIRRPGSYRIDVDPDGRATTVSARKGMAEVYGERTAFITGEGQTYRFFGSDLRDYESYGLLRADEFDRWSNERDSRWDNSASRRYVSPEMIGYEDLDQYGTWRKVPDYGSVWVPNRVAADWAPYRDGHWAWVEPWGWTWIDEAPWGFAPSHYGRWARIDNNWAWVPGPATARPVYAPALVAFVGGSDLRSSGGGNGTVAWFPLGPRDVYRPSYTASREYFNDVNTSNTVINRTNITNVYSNMNVTNITYANQQIPGAVVAVLAAAFAQSRPVGKETVRVNQQMIARAPVTVAAPVAPVHASVVGGQAAFGAKPPERAQARPVVAQVAPPPPPVPFAAKQGALAANAGKPLDPAAVAALKSAAPVPAPAIRVVTPTQAVAAPPRPASAPAAGQSASGWTAPSPAPAAPPVAAPPAAPARPAAPMVSSPVAPPAPAASPSPRPADRGAKPAGAPTAEPSASGWTAPSPAPPVAAPPAAPVRPARPAAPKVLSPVAPPAPAASPSPRPADRGAAPGARPASAPTAGPSASGWTAPSAAPAAPPVAAPPAAPARPAPPVPRAAPAVPPAPPTAAAPPPAPPRAVPAAPTAPAARAAIPASAAATEQRGRPKVEEGRAPGTREVASEPRRQRDAAEQGRKP